MEQPTESESMAIAWCSLRVQNIFSSMIEDRIEHKIKAQQKERSEQSLTAELCLTVLWLYGETLENILRGKRNST